MTCQPAPAKPDFIASGIAAPCQELLTCDLDGDGLKDLILMDDTNLFIFYQDLRQGFTREMQQTHQLEPRPCLVWTATLGGPAGSLLVMTGDGVTELGFTNRTNPPASRQIIRQATIVPEKAEGTNALFLSLSAKAAGNWPLLLVPTAGGLQVWKYADAWHQAQCISNSMNARQHPSVANPGYTTTWDFDLSADDVNGDGRDDLMTRCYQAGRTNISRLYPQQTNGLFAPEPTLIHADKVEPYLWLGWVDLSRDGKVDLIKSLWLNEPSFIPGVPAGKVLVSIYIADAHGRIPAEPQQVFRKSDWWPVVPVTDVDGDGFPDLVLGYVPMDSREGLRKQITSRKMDYSLRFYFYRPGAGFPKEADCQRTVAIHVDRATGPVDWSLALDFQRCARFGGDFNGDGKTDLLVRDHRDHISVYFFVSREKGFSPEPSLRFSCPEPIDEIQVTDLNRDGISDLIVKLEKQNGFRIFVSRK